MVFYTVSAIYETFGRVNCVLLVYGNSFCSKSRLRLVRPGGSYVEIWARLFTAVSGLS